ncbi:hypothetical protein M9Y10_000053 [Tritrichomonas musculus]|uniref:DUF559 domain-containing protein n=1 Tax=Tritrichomonas musculus TaxID=1915356 RepID=A0ABR2L369_9EUKA
MTRWNTQLVASEMMKENCKLIDEYKNARTKMKYIYEDKEYTVAWYHWTDKKHPSRPHLHGGNQFHNRPNTNRQWNNELVNELLQKEDCELVDDYINYDTKFKYSYHGSYYWISLHNWIGKKSRPHFNKNVLEKQFREYLEENNIEFIAQKSFDDLKSDKNKKLRFDFYLVQQNILVEMDEKPHFYVKRNMERDKLKDEYCLEHKIKLLRIDESTSKDDYKKALNDIIETDIYILRYGEIYKRYEANHNAG